MCDAIDDATLLVVKSKNAGWHGGESLCRPYAKPSGVKLSIELLKDNVGMGRSVSVSKKSFLTEPSRGEGAATTRSKSVASQQPRCALLSRRENRVAKGKGTDRYGGAKEDKIKLFLPYSTLINSCRIEASEADMNTELG